MRQYGAIAFLSFDRENLGVLNSDEERFRTVTFHPLDNAFVYGMELTPNQAGVFVQESSDSGVTLSQADQHGQVTSLPLRRGFGYGNFSPLDLKSGKRIFVGEAADFGSSQRSLFFADFESGRIRELPLGTYSELRFQQAYEISEGRIFGLFLKPDGKVKTLQLYGPLPGKELMP